MTKQGSQKQRKEKISCIILQDQDGQNNNKNKLKSSLTSWPRNDADKQNSLLIIVQSSGDTSCKTIKCMKK